MRAIFWKELRDARGLFFVFIAVTLALVATPDRLGRMWTGLSIFLAVPMLCCYFGARLLTSETEDEQLELLLTIPVPRWKIFAAKAGAGLLMTAAVLLVCALGASNVDHSRNSSARDVSLWITSVFLMYGLGAFFSLVWARSQGASFTAFLVFVIGMTGYDAMGRELGIRGTWETTVEYLVVLVGIVLAATGWAFCKADLTDLRDRRRTALRAGLSAALVASLALAYYLSSVRL